MKYTYNLHNKECNKNNGWSRQVWVRYTPMNMDYRATIDLLKLYNRADVGRFIVVPLIPNSQR